MKKEYTIYQINFDTDGKHVFPLTHPILDFMADSKAAALKYISNRGNWRFAIKKSVYMNGKTLTYNEDTIFSIVEKSPFKVFK